MRKREKNRDKRKNDAEIESARESKCIVEDVAERERKKKGGTTKQTNEYHHTKRRERTRKPGRKKSL